MSERMEWFEAVKIRNESLDRLMKKYPSYNQRVQYAKSWVEEFIRYLEDGLGSDVDLSWEKEQLARIVECMKGS